MAELSPKHKRFVAEYLIDRHATNAAIRAGYTKKTARQQGSRLLSNANIKALVNIKEEKLQEKLEVTKERIVAELAKIGFANMNDYMTVGKDGDPFLDFSKITPDQAAALSEVTVEDFKDGRGEEARDIRKIKFKLYDKRAALVDLGKNLGMFTEKVELTGKDGKDLLERTPEQELELARSLAALLSNPKLLKK